MTTHDAYLSATVAANEVTIRNQTAAIAAKDTEIASLRTRLDASSRRESDLLQRAANNLRVANEEAVQMCREKNRRIADLEEQRDSLIHSPVQNELAAIHAAHRAAVVRWSDAEASAQEWESAFKLANSQLMERDSQLRKAEQKHDDFKKKVLEVGYTDQTAEIRRLKHRVNGLVCILDQIRNQTSHDQREIL